MGARSPHSLRSSCWPASACLQLVLNEGFHTSLFAVFVLAGISLILHSALYSMDFRQFQSSPTWLHTIWNFAILSLAGIGPMQVGILHASRLPAVFVLAGINFVLNGFSSVPILAYSGGIQSGTWHSSVWPASSSKHVVINSPRYDQLRAAFNTKVADLMMATSACRQDGSCNLHGARHPPGHNWIWQSSFSVASACIKFATVALLRFAATDLRARWDLAGFIFARGRFHSCVQLHCQDHAECLVG